MRSTKVLYIAGWGRSGSTLISSILGSTPGLFAAGELAFFWHAASHHAWLCSCRETITKCPVWRTILVKAFGSRGLDPAFIGSMQLSVSSLLDKRRHGLGVLGRPLRPDQAESATLTHLGLFYEAIRESTGARVIIDSSKVPLYGSWLRQVPGLDVYFLHLVRDPRAVSYSWSKAKHNMSGTGSFAIPERSALQSSLRWIGVNQIFHSMRRRLPGRYLQIRYTDFLAEPHVLMDQIFTFIGEPVSLNPISEDGTTEIKPMHIAFGNPDRMQQGAIKLSIRNKWREEMPRARKLLVTLLCAPWMIRYGYPFRHAGENKTGGSGPGRLTTTIKLATGTAGIQDLASALLLELFYGHPRPLPGDVFSSCQNGGFPLGCGPSKKPAGVDDYGKN